MINGFIKGQALTLASPVIASGTIDYLTIRFTFLTNEWDNLDQIWVHFRQGDKVFDAQVVDGRVKEDEHINLTEGEWNVYLHGNTFENGEVKQRITTETQTVKVVATGNLEGEPFPDVDETTAEKLLAIAENAEEKADKAIEAVANLQIQKGVQSITAFPEVADEGDVVLLHRCNEISADDSNSGVFLDTAAIASLTLPEQITDRVWKFTATNPTGAGFMLTLEQRVIEGDEPYVLTGISLASENYAGRWYWREGKPYYDISNASTEPIPALIPLGKVSGFTATKDPLIDEDYDEHEDTDNTTIFRTVPREYMYSGGEWKLTERTDIAEGNLISNFGEIEKDGLKFFRLDLTDSRSLKNRNKKTVDIPIEGVKKTTTTVGGITLESAEIVFPKAEAGGTDIPLVSELPTNAKYGDMCIYARANHFSVDDAGKTIYFSYDWLNQLHSFDEDDTYNFSLHNTKEGTAVNVGLYAAGADNVIILTISDSYRTYSLNYRPNAEGVYSLISYAEDPDFASYYYSDEDGMVHITEAPKSFTIPKETYDAVEISEPEFDYVLFYHEPKLMIYSDRWSEVGGDIEKIWQTVDCVTPQMFGAVADGVADDTNAVQAALDKGGVVYFPAGVYKVTKQLTTTKPCVIKMFKQYPSQFWRSGKSAGRYDYPLHIFEGESDYEAEKGWDFGARIECYPSEGEQYGLLIGDGCEVDGLFMRAMDGFSGTLLAYDNSHAYGTDNLGDPITYSSYPSATRFKHIRLDCDRHHTETTIPESMFDFYPHGKYFYIFDDIVIGQQNEFATYGFRSIVDEEATWANSVRISNLCLNGLFDYPLYIVEENTKHSLTNWIFEGLSIQTYGYTYNEFEQAREGHKAVMTLKRMNYALFSGCYIWDLYAAKYVKLFDCENLNNISCVGCSEEFYYGTKKLVGDDGEEGIETVLKGRLQEVADDANVKTLTMSTTTMADGSNRIELADNHGNTVGTDIPAVSLSDEQISTGVGNWMTENAEPVEVVGKNKLNIYSDGMLFGYGLGTTGKPNNGAPAHRYYVVSHFIPAKYGDIFRMGLSGTACNWSDVVEFDKDYNFLKYHSYKDEDVTTSGWTIALTDENTAYIRVSWNLKSTVCTEEEKNDQDFVVNLEVAERGNFCITLNNADISYEPYHEELVGGLAQYFLLTSPNGTRYSVAVTDDGRIVGKDENGNVIKPNNAIDRIELTTETATLDPNVHYSFGEVATLTLDFTEGEADKVNEYLFSFISGETATVLTLPLTVKWVNELTVEPNKRYEISVVDNVALWCAVDYEVTE